MVAGRRRAARWAGSLAAGGGLAAMLAGASAVGADWTGNVLVMDGGTVAIAGHRLRLAGLDAPDNAQICHDADGAAYACGAEARRALAVIIAGRALRCSGDRRDQYRRPLVTCQAGETDIGRELVRAGWAVALPTPDYAAEEAEARSEGRGLWQGSFQRPDEWRRAAVPMPSHAMPRQQ